MYYSDLEETLYLNTLPIKSSLVSPKMLSSVLITQYSVITEGQWGSCIEVYCRGRLTEVPFRTQLLSYIVLSYLKQSSLCSPPLYNL